MPNHLSERIRALLRTESDGLTIMEIRDELEVNKYDVVRKSINKMPDAYIDRWVRAPNTHGKYAAVWCVVVPPKHCPSPEGKS
ncbi:MAG: hypothetical protein ACKO0Z_19525 [Betaproteobacteria bacterium]